MVSATPYPVCVRKVERGKQKRKRKRKPWRDYKEKEVGREMRASVCEQERERERDRRERKRDIYKERKREKSSKRMTGCMHTLLQLSKVSHNVLFAVFCCRFFLHLLSKPERKKK